METQAHKRKRDKREVLKENDVQRLLSMIGDHEARSRKGACTLVSLTLEGWPRWTTALAVRQTLGALAKLEQAGARPKAAGEHYTCRSLQAGKWSDELRYLDLRTDYQRKAHVLS